MISFDCSFVNTGAQELLRESQISLLQLSTVEVATQLSMRAFELFCAIEPTEYIDDLFKLRSRSAGPSSLKLFEEAINRETFWGSEQPLKSCCRGLGLSHLVPAAVCSGIRTQLPYKAIL